MEKSKIFFGLSFISILINTLGKKNRRNRSPVWMAQVRKVYITTLAQSKSKNYSKCWNLRLTLLKWNFTWYDRWSLRGSQSLIAQDKKGVIHFPAGHVEKARILGHHQYDMVHKVFTMIIATLLRKFYVSLMSHRLTKGIYVCFMVDPSNNPLRCTQHVSLSPFYKWENWGLGRLIDFPKVIKLITARLGSE